MAQSDRWRALAEALLGPAEFTSGEVARAAGVELDDARRLLIGDAVMFAADDAAAAAEIALGLVEAHARDPEVPDARAGLASGPVLAWEGDLFGPTVNLASRLVNLARPGTVLVAEELGEQLRHDPAFAVRHLRPVRLQGIGRVRSWVLRRAG